MNAIHGLGGGVGLELRLTFLYFYGMLCIDKKSEPKMVGSAYLMSKKISAIQTARQTLMATVHPEKVVPGRTAFSF